MNKLEVRFEHCYGIGKLTHMFNFSKKNAIIIYAPNGTMKTSFANTFKRKSESEEPIDRADPDAKVVCDIKADGNDVNPSDIFVINPDNADVDPAASISSLLASDGLKNRYERIRKELDEKKKRFLGKLKELSKSSDCEKELRETFSDDAIHDYDFAIYERLKDEIERTEPNLWGFKYNDVFDKDGKVKTFIEANRGEIQAYFDAYNDVLLRSEFFKAAVGDGAKDFGPDRAGALAKSVKDNAFFMAGHRIVTGAGITIDSYSELEELLKNEIAQALNDQDVRSAFEKIDKKLSNAPLKIFRDVVSADRSLLFHLLNYDEFKRKVWCSFIAAAKAEYEDAINCFAERKAELEEIFKSAEAELPMWKDIIGIFEDRFHAPFKIEIENQRDLVLKQDAPSLRFYYIKDDGQEVEQDKHSLMNILSKGELRAFAILQMVFQVEDRKRRENNILVFDDIADSFDYKNKYAIIEYLADYLNQGNFKALILTHNFDFYRTVVSRLQLRSDDSSLMTLKQNGEIKLKPAAYIQDVLSQWLKAVNDRNLIAMIPFARNIVEYTLGNTSSEYLFFTCCLHVKQDASAGGQVLPTMSITVDDVFAKLKSVFADRSDFTLELAKFANSVNSAELYYDWLKRVLSQIKKEVSGGRFDEINLSNKVVLSIGIRLLSEQFILGKMSSAGIPYVEPSDKQSRYLLNVYKKHFVSDLDYVHNRKILSRVGMMTPEQIHLNSFMYEPLVDMSANELMKLYDEVVKWER